VRGPFRQRSDCHEIGRRSRLHTDHVGGSLTDTAPGTMMAPWRGEARAAERDAREDFGRIVASEIGG